MPLLPSGDRSLYRPKHQGPTVLPNDFYFSSLVRHAHKPHLTAIRDVTFGYNASYAQFLTDVLNLRNVLRRTLEPETVAQIDNEGQVYINLLGPGGYEYTVGFFALMALGAVIVPLATDLPVKEASYFAQKARTVAVLTAARCQNLGEELRDFMSSTTNDKFKSINITLHVMQPPLRANQIIISSDAFGDLNQPGLVIFTSGSTGPPKGSVHRRGVLFDMATFFSSLYRIEEADRILHVLPVHHATGATVTLLPFLWSGGCVEFRSGSFSVEWTWERIRQGGVDFFSGVPTIYMRLMQHYSVHLTKLPRQTLEEYIGGIQKVKALICGSSALPRPLQQKWTELRHGRGILTRYGGSEFGGVFMVKPDDEGVPFASVGLPLPGVEVKLSDGDEGEILVKNNSTFSHYLHDHEATMKTLDDDGFFKTGDVGRREGEYYFILGRMSVDIIKSGGYKLSALDIEREILSLDFVAEVAVVGVDDEEFGQRVGAIVVLRADLRQSLTLGALRESLKDLLVSYKMPTLLRVVKAIPTTVTGKVQKNVLNQALFPQSGHPDIQVWKPRGKL